MYKPESYPDMSPYLVVDDAQATLDFVEQVFRAEPLRIFRSENGSIMHAEARIGDSVIMIGQNSGGPDALVHVYVSDVEDVFHRAKEAGVAIVQDLMLKDDGDRRGGVRDKNGTTWWIARQEQN